MWSRRALNGLVVAALAWLAGCSGGSNSSSSSSLAVPSGEILYIVDAGSVTTYAVDEGSLVPSSVGNSVSLLPGSASLQQLVPAPDDHFLYALWTDSQQQEYLSGYATDSLGVPQLPAIQTLAVSVVSQLNIHPNGKFAYAMQLQSSGGPYPTNYISDIFLFRIQASGTMELDRQIQGKYGPTFLPTLLYGVSAGGNELYLQLQKADGPVYWERAVNRENGTLEANVLLFQPPSTDSVIFGENVIIDYQSALNTPPPRHINVLPNRPNPLRQLIHCGSAMLSACATATNVELDPFGRHLFLTDPVSQEVQVADIDLERHVITDTGNFLPFTAQTPGYAFSPDGTLVYAWVASDNNLHVFQFDPTSGQLAEGSVSIPMPSGAGFLPALRR